MQTLATYGGASVGDIAVLKSGGPDMTIGAFDVPNFNPQSVTEQPPIVRCYFITETGQPMNAEFPFYTLNIKATEKAAPVANPDADTAALV